MGSSLTGGGTGWVGPSILQTSSLTVLGVCSDKSAHHRASLLPAVGGEHWAYELREKNKKESVSTGYASLHANIEGHSRVDYSKSLENERTVIAAEFWPRTNIYYE